ncbi:MAG: RNA methyltransferase [Pseudomonadota bacterium]
MVPIAIEDPTDPRIAAYSAIKERDLTGRGDRFIVEGKITLDILVQRSRFKIESLFIADHRLSAVADILRGVPGDVPIYTASRDLFDAIAGFPVHRGVLACARKGQPLALESLARQDRVVLGIGLSNHDNVGALFRNAAGLGVKGIVLDRESCDPLYRKAIRVSAGTALWLPYFHGQTGEALINALKRQDHTLWALTPDKMATPIWDKAVPETLSLVVGAEGPGLGDDIIAACEPVSIPMASGVDSLNVATAAAIAMAVVDADRT